MRYIPTNQDEYLPPEEDQDSRLKRLFNLRQPMAQAPIPRAQQLITGTDFAPLNFYEPPPPQQQQNEAGDVAAPDTGGGAGIEELAGLDAGGGAGYEAGGDSLGGKIKGGFQAAGGAIKEVVGALGA